MDVLNIILAALSKGLDALYPQMPIYPEFVPQGLPEKCFLIGFAGDVEIKHDVGSRYKVSGKLDIAYYAPQRGAELQGELNTVFASLSLHLRSIEHNGVKLRLHKHKRNVTDDVLHDICDFAAYLFEVDQAPLIDSVKVKEAEVNG